MTTTAPARALPAPSPEPVRSRREVLTALSGLLLGLFIAILSSTIVANALPTIVADLHGDQTGYTWIVTATLLTTTASTPIWGKLADLFSKKLLVQAAILIFIATSIGAGLAGSMGELIAWRAGQGLGAGGLQALAQVVIAVLIPPRERGRYSGYLGAVLAAATVSGPIAGGLLVSTPALGWRWCFFVGVPIGLLALVVLQKTLHVPTVKREVHLDYLGAALISGGVSVLLVWISLAGSQFAWGSTVSLTLAGLGVAALVAAVFVELRAPEPVVPMWLFRERTVVLSVVASLVVGVVMFSSTVYLSQYFQIARSYDPTTAGLLTLPLVGGLVLASTGSGQLISRYGRWKAYLVAGAVLITAGLGLLATIDHTTPVPRIGVFLAILGLGIGMSMQNLVLAVQNTVDVRDVGAASSLVAFLRSLGGTIGVTILGVVLNARVTALSGTSSALGGLATGSAAEAEAVRAAYGDGLALVFGISAVASLVTIVAVLLIREVPLRTTVGPAPEPTGPDTIRPPDERRTDAVPADAVRAAAVDGSGAGSPRPAERTTVAAGARHGSRTEARDRLLAVLLPRPQEALRALDDIEAAQHGARTSGARARSRVSRAPGAARDPGTRANAQGVRRSNSGSPPVRGVDECGWAQTSRSGDEAWAQ